MASNYVSNVPEYLRRVLRSYLSDRTLSYGDGKVRTVTAGVTQGSVFGPLLWNVMYDYLLRSNLQGCNTTNSSAMLVAFADDVAVLASRRTTEWLEISAISALTTVESWIEKNGLQLSATKTEAVMLTSKRAYTKPKLYIK